MAKIIISKDKEIKCQECDHSATPEQMKNDTSRMYQTQKGILCECCYDDYIDAIADYED